MDPILLQRSRELTPDLNPRICNSIAYEQMKDVEKFMDLIWRTTAKDFPAGITYDGDRSVTPQEEFDIITKERYGKSTYEISRSDFYLRAYKLSYMGQELFTRYLYLPFAERGGLMYIRGNRFSIHPMLTDPAFSVGSKSMFIQLTRARLTFERLTHHYYMNDQQCSAYVVWSWIHMTARKNNARRGTNAKIVYSTLAHYLFVMNGVTNTFKQYANTDVIISDEETFDVKKYPRDQYFRFSSNGAQPRTWQGEDYESSRLYLIISAEQFNANREALQSLIAGFFYIVDHFPRRIYLKYVDNTYTWKVTLGTIIYGYGTSDGLMVNEIEDHIRSVREYIDPLVEMDLKRSGILCNEIGDLFMIVMNTLSKPAADSNESISSIYNKRLSTLKPLLFELTSKITKLMYQFRIYEKKRSGDDQPMDVTGLNKVLNDHLANAYMPRLNVNKDHPEVVPLSTSSDNLFFGVTSVMVSQGSTNAGGAKKKINLGDPTKKLHVSVAEVGAYSALPKSDPTGRSRLNPCVQVNNDGMVKRNKKFIELLDHVQTFLM